MEEPSFLPEDEQGQREMKRRQKESAQKVREWGRDNPFLSHVPPGKKWLIKKVPMIGFLACSAVFRVIAFFMGLAGLAASYGVLASVYFFFQTYGAVKAGVLLDEIDALRYALASFIVSAVFRLIATLADSIADSFDVLRQMRRQYVRLRVANGQTIPMEQNQKSGRDSGCNRTGDQEELHNHIEETSFPPETECEQQKPSQETQKPYENAMYVKLKPPLSVRIRRAFLDAVLFTFIPFISIGLSVVRIIVSIITFFRRLI